MKLKSFSLGLAAIAAILSVPQAAFADTVFRGPRINGLEIDRCITSYRFPDGCSQGATEHAATMFCRHEGYSHASNWGWQDEPRENNRAVYKLLEEAGNSSFREQQGAYIFFEISCVEKPRQSGRRTSNTSEQSQQPERRRRGTFEQVFEDMDQLFEEALRGL